MKTIGSKTLLVTGGCGFIGSAFVRQALPAGYRVVILDALTYAGHRANIEGLDLLLVEGNIGDRRLVRQLFSEHRFDAVINFAAESHVDRSIDGPSVFIETNIQGTFNLLQCSLEYWNSLDDNARQEFRYVQISTDEVFGSLGDTGKFSEASPYTPNSPYSASKASADLLTRAWFHTYGLPTLVTNCSNNYGPRQFPEKLIPHMITCALDSRPLPVYGDGKNVRDWIHVDDHCRGILLALEKGKPGSSYCFGGNEEWNNIELVRLICSKLDQIRPRSDGKRYESQIQFVTDRLGHDRRYAIDDSLARHELGYVRHFDFARGLDQTIHWYLKSLDWCNRVKGTKP